MTHAELRAAHPSGPLEPCDCPGELHALGSIFDPTVSKMVEVHQCPRCGHAIVFEPPGTIRNDYLWTGSKES